MSIDDPEQSDAATRDDLSPGVADAIAEVLESVEIDSEPEERLVLADAIVQKFISPLMIQRAAGATSQVTVIMNPSGGVSRAHSIKARNALVNLKHAVAAVPASIPALASFYERHGISADLGTTALAVLYLFPLLKSIAKLVQVPLTQQAAAVLMVMWNTKREHEDTVDLAVY